MKRPLHFLIALLIFSNSVTNAQERPRIKFGNVSEEDFKQSPNEIDANAAAVVIADIGSTEIIGNNSGSFSLLFKKLRRVRIINKNGYSAGNVVIQLYSDGENVEDLENIKAVTYNLENGKIVETKLNIKEALFKDKLDKNRMVRKFTFPNMKEGSVVEYEYQIKSDFIFNLQPWEFQGEFPSLWSEYNVAMPSFYNYVTLTQGYHPYHIKDANTRRSSFYMADTRSAGSSDRASFITNVTDYRWVMKDVPALKEENYTSTLDNHISRIEFQLASIGDPFTYTKIMSTWEMAAKRLKERDDFGAQLGKDNSWLSETVQEASGKATTDISKAKNIYSWVRDHFTCTSSAGLYMDQPLKNILKNRNGNVAEINLFLTAMMRKADLKAYPVILSTKSHGYAHSLYPLMDRFNYLVCRVELKDTAFYLDASEPGMGFGKLGYKCYNGHARIIADEAIGVDLDASTLTETKNTMVFLINDEKGKYVGTIQQTPGYYESLRVRNLFKEKGRESITAEIRKSIGDEMLMSNFSIDSALQYDEPLAMKYDVEMKPSDESLIYFNPLMGENVHENPFKSAQRLYPVEMPFTLDETYTLQMEIPKGYAIDEIPKPMVIKVNDEGDAVYEYRISTSGNSISFRSRLLVKRAYFLPEEYEGLREFFAMIVKKQGEQIVFKKKANP